MADIERDPETGVFLKGKKGGPGRPKGSRNKLGEAFLADMLEDWSENGPSVIAEVRREKPDQYLKVVASILPKDINLNVNDAESMTDDELIARIRELDAAISPFLASRAGEADEGASAKAEDGRGAAKPSRVH